LLAIGCVATGALMSGAAQRPGRAEEGDTPPDERMPVLEGEDRAPDLAPDHGPEPVVSPEAAPREPAPRRVASAEAPEVD
ncbi:hypothetical protein, partial [Klebsiella pneumoniae]|uniref:hypothetical protein n=1 Tax=Klebsiella pneumoniae TaxID=573 RepID=UPI001954A927